MENNSIKKNRIKVYFILLFVTLGSLMIFSFGKVLYKDRGSQQSTSAVYGSKPSNVKTSTLPYNGCGGGCISNNSICCGTCMTKGIGCGAEEYMCVKILQLDGSYRLECWHFGPELGTIANTFGIDISNAPINNCGYFRIRKELNSIPPVILDSNVIYNNELTIAGMDTIVDTSYVSLKYHFDFFTGNDSFLFTQTYE
jgi:hypothetical protein